MIDIIKIENLRENIFELRGEQVLLDSDVAVIYGVETKRINEAVKNNPEKFPDGYLFQVDKEEWNILKSKISTSMPTSVATSTKGGKIKLPNAFSEKGLYMLATILKSSKATEATFTIIETFSKLRELSRNIRQLSLVENPENQKTLLQKSGELLTDIFDDDLDTGGTETTVELNLAVLKFKHIIKKKKK